MNVEIDENEMREYANRRMKSRIDDMVEKHLKEIEWYRSIDQMVFAAVEKKITLERCNKALDELDREKLIDSISGYLASRIVERLFDGC